MSRAAGGRLKRLDLLPALPQFFDWWTVAIGEIGLTGALRNVRNLEQRLRELGRRGARQALVPAGGASKVGIPGLEVIGIESLGAAIAHLS